MRAATLRRYVAVHTWVGLAAGFALFIAFYAGAITIFTEELHVWQSRTARLAPMQSPDKAQPLIDAVLAAHPAAKQQFFLRLPSPHEPSVRLDWYEKTAQGQSVEHQFALSATGQLVELKADSDLAHFLYRLHYTAGLPASWGIYVLGVVCVLYGLALVSGVVIYLPTLVKDLFALRIGKNIKRMWQDAHNAIGMLSLPFHVMYAWSSAVLTLGLVMLAPFQYLVFDGKLLGMLQPDIAASAPSRPAGVVVPLLPAAQLIAAAQRAIPGLALETLNYRNAGDANGEVEMYGDVAQRTLTSMGVVVMQTGSGKIQRVVQPESYSAGMRFLRGLQTLHFGNYGHYAVKWVYFVLGMAGAFLFYSGNLLWIEARRKRQRAVQPRSGRLMAQGTLGVCLGAVVGIAAVFLVNRVLVLAPGALPQWEERTYYGVFFAAIVWAFVRPPARGGFELLTLSAVLSLLLPLAQWWRSGLDPLSAVWQGEWVVAGVDAVALLFAWGYWAMARALLARGKHGDPCSVWSLQKPPVAVEAALPQRHANAG